MLPDSNKNRALVVGISEYSTDPLEFCASDAQAVQEILTMPEYSFEVTTLLDGQAMRHAIVEEVQKLLESSSDNLFFYFSGHGKVTPYGVYLVTVDANPVEPGVDLSTLARLFRAGARTGRTTTVILDCCHAGAMTFATEHGPPPLLRPADVGASFVGLPEGNLLIAACRTNELAFEYATLGHGIFTFHLIEGLLGGAANEQGQMTASGIHDYVARALAESTASQAIVYRGDIAGLLVLGSGFEPVQRRPADPEKRAEVIRQAATHIDTFQAEVGKTFPQRELWSETAYKTACQLLRPILQWFEKREAEYPELKHNETFKDLLGEARAWQGRLGDLSNVSETPWGRVVRELGFGTFGTVRLIESRESTPSLKAFKVYHGQDIRLRDKLHRFRRGFEAMKMLDHPHVIKVGEFTECPIGFFMDYIDGPNFREFTGTLEVPDQLRLLLTVAETLAHAHSRSVVHRDVKPENILLTNGDGVWRSYLTDFDLAWFSTASVLTLEAIGSTFYCAPEQIYKPRSAAAHDPKVDQYAFGQLCFFGLTGSDPIPNTSDNVTVLRDRLRSWPSGDGAAAALNLYQKATASLPSNRYHGMREVCDELHEIVVLSEMMPDQDIAIERLVRELGFSLVGLPDQINVDTNTFCSLAGRTQVEVETLSLGASTATLRCRLNPLGGLTLQGLDHDTARKRLNVRIDDVLRGIPDTMRRSGRAGTYEVFLDVSKVPLTMRGVEKIRKALSRVIETIERD
jgi:hypothetical protein